MRVKRESEVTQSCPTLGDPKDSACPMQEIRERDVSSILGWGKPPGVGNSNPFQYSCLENPMDRGTWWATVHGATKSQTQLSD